MLSSGFGGVPSTFVTSSSNTELVAVENVLGFQSASEELRNRTGGVDLIARLITVENVAASAANAFGAVMEFPPQAMTSNMMLIDGETYTAAADLAADGEHLDDQPRGRP
jgi:hypothetical protein